MVKDDKQEQELETKPETRHENKTYVIPQLFVVGKPKYIGFAASSGGCGD
jgi:hypothetical protein